MSENFSFDIANLKVEDEAKEHFIDSCVLRKKMYCIIGPNDLARLFVAYKRI